MSSSILPEAPSVRERFRAWRRSRPFWGGLTAILGGVEMYSLTAAPFQMVLVQGVAGVSSMILCVLLVSLALITWFQPHLRMITGVTIIVLALASVLLTNLGGFVIGMLLALHGGASIAGWKPVEQPTPPRLPLPDAGRAPAGTTGSTRSAAAETTVSKLAAPSTATSSGAKVPDTIRTPGPGPRAPLTDLLFDKSGGDPGDADEEGDPGSAASDPADDGGSDRSASGRPPLGGGAAGFGLILVTTLVAANLAFPARAHAATPPQSAGVRTGAFCTLMPWLCPKATPTPTPTPTPSPSAKPTSPIPGLPGGLIPTKPPTVPGLGTPATTPETTGNASGCDPALKANPKGLALPKVAKLMVDCAAAQVGGVLGYKTAASDARHIASPLPMHLVATKQTIKGLTYDGIATLQTSAGPIKTLKLRASSVTIEGYQQSITYPGGLLSITSTSNVVLSGNVSLYVLKQKGNVFGLLPLTLSVSMPPPLVLPDMFFTNVDQQVAYLQADSLKVTPVHIKVT